MDENDPLYAAIDKGGGQTCDVRGVVRELGLAGFAIVRADEIERLTAERDQYLTSAVEYGNLSERLRAALLWLDNHEPELIAAAVENFGFKLVGEQLPRPTEGK